MTRAPTLTSSVRRAPICVGPRGLAFDEAKGQLHVACTDGKLVTLDAKSGAELRRLSLDSDLRDWRLERQQTDGAAPATINRALSTLRRYCAWAVAASMMTAALAHAQSDYPTKPIRMIVPSAPGSGPDTMARAVGQHLRRLRQRQAGQQA